MQSRVFILIAGAVALPMIVLVGFHTGIAGEKADAHVFTVAEADASTPTVALDAESDASHVVWAQREGGETVIYHRSVQAGDTLLSEPVRVSDTPGAATHNQAPPQVAIGPGGVIYVAHLVQTELEERRFPASNIRLMRSSDGGETFEDAAAPHEALGFPTSHHFFDMAVADDGAVYLTWLDSRARDGARQDMTHVTDGDGASSAHLHDEEDLSGTELRVARSDDQGRSFSSSVRIASNTCQCCRTSIALASSDTVYVAWRHIFEGGIRDMAVARSTDRGQSFEPYQRLHADEWQIDGCPHTGPQIVSTPEGRLRSAWYTGRDGQSGLRVVEHYSWSLSGEARSLTTDQPVSLVSMTASTASGNWIAWEDARARTVQLAPWPGEEAAPGTAVFSETGGSPSISATDRHVVFTWEREGGVFLLRFPM